jgi:UBX domain-containing protein 1
MLQSGHAPLDLLQVEPGQPVDVRVAHRMTVDWSPPPKSTLQSFTGRGHRLGDLAEPSSSSSSSSSPPSGQAKTTTSSTPQKSIVPEPNIDKSQPTTTLQLRLADGSRINATFNSGNTVVQLHAYITSVSPSNRPFSLLAGRPPLKLAHDDGRSLTEANLLNTVIIQQWQ